MFNENYYLPAMDRIGGVQDCVDGRARGTPARITSSALLGPRKEVVIVHNGREYRLRLTQNGRLILTA